MTEKTKAALEKVVNSKIAAAMPTHVPEQPGGAQYIRLVFLFGVYVLISIMCMFCVVYVCVCFCVVVITCLIVCLVTLIFLPQWLGVIVINLTLVTILYIYLLHMTSVRTPSG